MISLTGAKEVALAGKERTRHGLKFSVKPCDE
jgi:hypothetical protein